MSSLAFPEVSYYRSKMNSSKNTYKDFGAKDLTSIFSTNIYGCYILEWINERDVRNDKSHE